MLAASMCLYCEVEPPRVGDLYCCEGCKTLAQLNLKTPRNLSPTLADQELCSKFGFTIGPITSFQCKVDAIACEACLTSLVQIQNDLPEIKELVWSRSNSTIQFTFLKSHELPSFVFDILSKMQLHPVWVKPSELNMINGSAARRKFTYVGVTGALAGNIMLFSLPVYTGALDEFRLAFEWLQALLFLPVFFWSAQPFYKSAWISFKLRQLNLDLPLVIAFIAGSAASFYALFSGSHDLYFDSLSGFLFLIIVSRYLVERSLIDRTRAPTVGDFLTNSLFNIERNNKAQRVRYDEIIPLDVLTLRAGDRLPTDGELLSPSADFDFSWMTGECFPRLQLKGSKITAGSKLITSEAQVRVLNSSHQTEFARIIASFKSGQEKLQSSLESKIGTALVFTCFICIIALFLFAPFLGSAELLRRCIALLIVACPCAISFAAPLARAKAGQIAAKNGFWVQDNLVWQRLLNVKTIAFDKTGTLTGGWFRLSDNSPLIDTHWKRVILSLENISSHPIAASLRKEWGSQPLFAVENAKEQTGLGVSGTILNREYQIHRSIENGELLKLELLQDGQRTLELYLEDSPRENLAPLMKNLGQQFEIFLLSGDSKKRVELFAKKFGFKVENAKSELTPIDKLECIKAIEPDIYFGDGTNDVMALQKAPVAVAIGGSSLEAQVAADVIILNGELIRLTDLLKIAKGTDALLKRNFIFALAYNVAAGTAALLGFINPLVAAILMPIASVVLLLSTLHGNKILRNYEEHA